MKELESVIGKKEPCDGQLWYRVETLIRQLGEEFGFERIAYFLLMGELPDEVQEKRFKERIGNGRGLPVNSYSGFL